MSKRVPEIEYLGPVIHLYDAIQIRVKKSDEIDILGLIDGFENINGVASAELQLPTSDTNSISDASFTSEEIDLME